MTEGDPWAAYERLVARDPTELTNAECRLVALGSLRTELNNGGFDQYFFNSAGDLAVVALEGAGAVGADGLADLLGRALEVLNVPDPSNRDSRQEALDTAEEDKFEELDREYLALEASTDLDSVMRDVMESADTP